MIRNDKQKWIEDNLMKRNHFISILIQLTEAQLISNNNARLYGLYLYRANINIHKISFFLAHIYIKTDKIYSHYLSKLIFYLNT